MYIICCVYFPPNTSIIPYESFTAEVERLIMAYKNNVFVICGDFNLPEVTWENDDHGLIYSTPAGGRVQCVPESFAFLNFVQLNRVLNYYNSILDLVFCNLSTLGVNRSDKYLVPSDSNY